MSVTLQVDIDFVDFGDCLRKPVKDVFRLEKEFFGLGFQAIECSMANIKPDKLDLIFKSCYSSIECTCLVIMRLWV